MVWKHDFKITYLPAYLVTALAKMRLLLIFKFCGKDIPLKRAIHISKLFCCAVLCLQTDYTSSNTLLRRT